MTGFQYRHVGVVGVGDGKRNDRKKNESVFRFRFFWATEKPTLKSRFSVGKNREKTTFDFRFTTLIVTDTFGVLLVKTSIDWANKIIFSKKKIALGVPGS